jgi:hypothetical protein
LRQELVDVGRDCLVEVVLLAVQAESNGVGKAVRKQAASIEVLEIFFEAAKRPGAIRAEPENVPSYLAGLVRKPMWFWEKVWIQQADEVCEAVVITVVRGCGEKDNMVSLRGQFLD